jgi:hypothetical protein
MFLFGNPEVSANDKNSAIDSNTTGAFAAVDSFNEQATNLQATLKNFVIDTNMESIFKNAQKSIIGMDNASKNLIKSMGGVADFTGLGAARANEFRNTLNDAFLKTLEIGGTFKDVTDSVEGLAAGMGRMVNPSAKTLENMVDISKSTGIASKEIATMVTEFVRYGGTQDEALNTMHELANESRKMGINTAAYMKDVNVNMKRLGGFGFKSGIEGLKQMSKQATMLRTTMEKIGAKGFADDLLDPEKAIQAAANIQMLGGAVGKLADPFQLMHMAQTDMAGLQDELIKSSKAAFTFNKATGGFDASTQDLYRLREMAKITGQNIDDMVESGREAAKLDYISSKFSLDGLSEEQQGLVASLAQIDKGGNVKIDIPGFEENNRNLEDLMKDDGFKTALDQYQLDQSKSEKDIAIAQMTISDKQLAAQNTIKEAVIASMAGQGTRDKFLKDIAEGNDKINALAVKTAGDAAPATATGAGVEAQYQNMGAGAAEGLGDVYTTEMSNALAKKIQELKDKIAKAPVEEAEDLFLGANNSVPKIMSKGSIYKGIVGDEVAIGTNLTEAFNKSGKLNEIMASVASTNNTGGGNASVDGKIDININLTGAISGDKNSDIEKIFNSPQVQKQIMDTVLYKLDSYKNQQGVLSK